MKRNGLGCHGISMEAQSIAVERKLHGEVGIIMCHFTESLEPLNSENHIRAMDGEHIEVDREVVFMKSQGHSFSLMAAGYGVAGANIDTEWRDRAEGQLELLNDSWMHEIVCASPIDENRDRVAIDGAFES